MILALWHCIANEFVMTTSYTLQIEILHCSSVACAALCGSLLLISCLISINTQKIYFIREHVLRNFLAKQSLKTVKQQNKLLLFWVLHWRNTMILWLHWNFQTIPVSWIILIMERIKSWQWLLFKASWKTPLLYQLLIKYVFCGWFLLFFQTASATFIY